MQGALILASPGVGCLFPQSAENITHRGVLWLPPVYLLVAMVYPRTTLLPSGLFVPPVLGVSLPA